jgi:tetratricopeptide (TPR) repeat protein
VGREDWYRRTTWSDHDRQAFVDRLARSRGTYKKAQYVRIQASYLEATADSALVRAALSLLDMMLDKWPDPSQVAQAHHQRATCYVRLGEPMRAVECFRMALQAERGYPNARTRAAIDLAWLTGTRELSAHYPEALAALAGAGDLVFPVDLFKAHGAQALILSATGQRGAALAHARWALEAAAATDSGFRYHRHLGLVGEAYEDVAKRLRELAAAEI